ncbi:very long-chain specific acyl-CoA dehydrogenase, mitochondrial-like [Corticium candelabrum]|uniref:very long-chain specific acyl-CoA dehydrogenase, mitochondrial-like n=1 Tax=Corticium candelabrum TaxID=121492 RepID=UPI002E262D21|nr:very long-chain specific acyl-CoA dehydrogenase, mitochondrial-like [Corticium candelabrum]
MLRHFLRLRQSAWTKLQCGQSWKRRLVTGKETTSFALNLFRGETRTQEIFPYPEVLTDDQKETLHLLIDPATKFFEQVNDPARNDSDERVPDDVLDQFKQLGTYGMQVPSEYGGIGLTNTQYARLGEITGGSDLALAVMMGAHQSIGFKGILLYGDKQQKEKYLPKVASGEWTAAYCLTEPGSGSDAQSIRSRATLSDDGKHYILNGSKIWISNGSTANLFTVFAQTPLTDTKTGETKDRITAFIVERSFPGVSSGLPEAKMGIKASPTAEVFFDNVKIPVENVLQEPGAGFKIAVNVLNSGRFGMAAAMAGCMKYLIKRAVQHTTGRVQFGSRLDTYGSVQNKIARMALNLYVTESMAYIISGNMDRGVEEFQLEAAISKIFGSEAAWTVADECIQLHGGMGYMKSAGLERVLRDLRIFRIFEGANDILRLFIALTGMQYAGSHLKELQAALQNPLANLGLVVSEGMKRAQRSVGMTTAEPLGNYVHPEMRGCAETATKLITHFGGTVEQLLSTYGKNIIHEQFILDNIADAAIDMYGTVCVLSRCSRSFTHDLPSSEHEKLLTEVYCKEAGERIERNLQAATSADEAHINKKLTLISQQTVENEAFIPHHPLGL